MSKSKQKVPNTRRKLNFDAFEVNNEEVEESKSNELEMLNTISENLANTIANQL